MIKIFSTPTCPYCVALKDWLKNKNMEYTDVNVAEDLQARDEMIQKSGQMGVPVVDIDGQIIVGFDKGRIAQILGLEDN